MASIRVTRMLPFVRGGNAPLRKLHREINSLGDHSGTCKWENTLQGSLKEIFPSKPVDARFSRSCGSESGPFTFTAARRLWTACPKDIAGSWAKHTMQFFRYHGTELVLRKCAPKVSSTSRSASRFARLRNNNERCRPARELAGSRK